jgi:hypothetical protein
MACGNNHVSRDHLSSQPTSVADTTSKLFGSQPRALERAPKSQRWGGRDGQMYYSQSNRETIDYFVGPDGKETFRPDRHVHVIHDEAKHEVRLVLTDRTHKGEFHSEHVSLSNPSGNEVNTAIGKLVEKLNARPRGTREVSWP